MHNFQKKSSIFDFLTYVSKAQVNIFHTFLVKINKNIVVYFFSGIKINILRPVSITQLVGQCIIICKGRSSNPGHPTYSPYKGEF